MTHSRSDSDFGCRAAVVIPARNESRRLPACLDALKRAVSRSGHPVCPVVVVNDSTDDTADIARQMLSDFRWPAIVLQMDGAPGVGAARAKGFDHALAQWGPQIALMGTDADSTVDEDWLTGMFAELETADLVFGAVVPDPDELAGLGRMQARFNHAEGAYMQTAIRLSALLDPRAHDPMPSHHNASGANFALTAGCYEQIGGFPPLPLSEDRELARRADRFDLRVRYAEHPKVTTSCRLAGRTGGGMAEALRARCDQLDPLCDEWLEPAGTFLRRHALRGALRACWPDAAALSRTCRRMGLKMVQPPAQPTFGAFWQQLEQTEPSLRRRRIRQSEASRDLRVLRARLEQIEPAGKAKAS